MELLLVDELANGMLLFLTVEASDVEAHHCELLQLWQFTVISPGAVVLLVCSVVEIFGRSVQLQLPPTFLLWSDFDVLHLSVIVVLCTVDATVTFLLWLFLLHFPTFSFLFLLLLGRRFCHSDIFLTLRWMHITLLCVIW